MDTFSTERDLQKIPLFARFALAVHAVRKIQPYFNESYLNVPKNHIEVIKNAVDGVERYIAHIHDEITVSKLMGSDDIHYVYKLSYSFLDADWGPAYCDYAFSVYLLRTAYDAAYERNYSKANENISHCIMITLSAQDNWLKSNNEEESFCHSEYGKAFAALKETYDFLYKNANRQGWNDFTPIPLNFISNNLKQNKIQSLQKIELIQQLENNPDLIKKLDIGEFEDLIITLFKGFGYYICNKVEEYKIENFIIAIKNNEKYIIDCRHKNIKETIGIEKIKHLHKLVINQKAKKGIIVTTSFLSKSGIKYISDNSRSLELIEKDEIIESIALYLKINIGKLLKEL